MANTIRLRRGSTTPTAGSFVEGEPAWDSTGKKLYVKAADGSMVLINGAGTGDVVAANNNAFTGANTFYNATGQTIGTGTSTQDGLLLKGRAGGSSSYRVSILPGTLTASRTLTLADGDTTLVAGTMVATGAATSSGLTMATSRLLGRTTASTGAIEELTVGIGLSLASGALIAVAREKSVTIETPTATEKIIMFFTTAALTVSQIRSVIIGGTNVTFSIRYGTDVSAAGTEVVTSGIQVTNTTTGLSTTSFNSASIPADRFVWITTSAVTGSVTQLAVTVVF